MLIQEGGLDVGCGRHKAARDKVSSMGNSLGAFEEEALWRYGPHSNQIHEKYVDFLHEMETAFTTGWQQGCNDYSDKFPEVLIQFQQKGVSWGEMRNEVYPTGFALVTQDLKALKPLLPKLCIEYSALTIREKDRKREEKAKKALREERERLAQCGDSDVEEEHDSSHGGTSGATMSTCLAKLVADAEKQQSDLAAVSDRIGTIKEEGSVMMLTAQGEVVPKADMSSSHVMRRSAHGSYLHDLGREHRYFYLWC